MNASVVADAQCRPTVPTPGAHGLQHLRFLARKLRFCKARRRSESSHLMSYANPFKEESKMNEKILGAIRQRARAAVSNEDLVRAVFDSFRSQSIDLRHVSLEEMKAALLEAARAAREPAVVSA